MVIICFVVGLIAGTLAGLFGLGGGVVVVPALVLLANFSLRQAVGTSLAALLLPVGILGVWQYYQRGFVVIPAALVLAAGVFLGTWLGARLSLGISTSVVQRGFAIFLVGIAFHLWRTA